MSKLPSDSEIQAWATGAVTTRSRDMSKAFCEKFGVTRQTAASALRKLVADGWIVKSGSQTRPVYSLGANRLLHFSIGLPVLEEDQVWFAQVKPWLSLRPNVESLAFYCFTEIVNNASDHSGGSSVFIWVSQRTGSLVMQVIDDGEGVFQHIASRLNLPDLRCALLELSKGKTTTDPTRHSGQGIFFSSKMCDYFSIGANGLEFEHKAQSELDILEERGIRRAGATLVYMRIALDTERTTKGVFDQYSNPDPDGEGGFYKTVVPVRLARLGSENLVSRSQAKRLLAGLERFRLVVLDFVEVDEIGQAFSDEVFRVFRNMHPSVELIPVNMSEHVEKMVLPVFASWKAAHRNGNG
jgi:hypothetical protein